MPEVRKTREQVLEESVKELGKRLAYISNDGKFNPEIAAILERARAALRYRDDGR